MNELERASRASRSVSRSSQYSRRQRRQQQHELSDQQHQHQQPTTGDESSWETDRERGSSNELLRGPADSRTHGSQSNVIQLSFFSIWLHIQIILILSSLLSYEFVVNFEKINSFELEFNFQISIHF